MAIGDTDLSAEIRHLYEERARVVIANLREKYMDGHYVPDRQAALHLLLDLIPEGASVGRGDSVTLNQLGVFPALQERGWNSFTNPPRSEPPTPKPSADDRLAMQRQVLLSDIYLTSTNAITLDGTIVSTDGSGNRVAAMCFGPRKVIVVTGCNKICPDVDAAMARIRDWAGPVNALRYRLKQAKDDTPVWGNLRYTVIIDGNQPVEQGKICVILVGEQLGL